MYRANYSKVDVFNKLTFGPKSGQMPYKTRDWRMRFFFATIAMCETNAFLAYTAAARDMGKTTTMDKSAFRHELIK